MNRSRRARLSLDPLEDRLAPATFTVNNADNSGTGSLRWAINRANAVAGADVIKFAIGTGQQTIDLVSALPAISGRVTIAGHTQPGFDTTTNVPLIELNGQNAGTSVNGLVVGPAASGTVIRGLVINRFDNNGITILADNCRVRGCRIGTDPSGTVDLGNGAEGITLWTGASGNVIGGTTAAHRNLISGNDFDGVYIHGLGTTGNIVQGNRIGTDATGTLALANSFDGIAVDAGASGNTIGGKEFGQGNLISGNATGGILFAGPRTTGNRVQGNFIGTNAAGTAALGNEFGGVTIWTGAKANIIGGSGTGAGNLISGNNFTGVETFGVGTDANRVAGNRIGVNGAGTAALANLGDGVSITLGAKNNVVGGTAVGSGNVISFNSGDGVFIAGAGTNGNTVLRNYVGTDANGSSPFPNSGDGVTIQDGAKNNVIGGTLAGSGNVISGNGDDGISLVAADGNTIQGNRIGVTSAGSSGIGNTGAGILITDASKFNIIGGTTAAARNVIADNLDGIVIESGSSANQVKGNFIGTNALGDTALGNGFDGIRIDDADHNVIGGTTAAARNLISGNPGNGITIQGDLSSGNSVRGNFIGTAAGGTLALANLGHGVAVRGAATGNVIGGAVAGAGNVISGNAQFGILIEELGTDGNVVQRNFIGTDLSAAVELGNGFHGVFITDEADNNLIGGTASGTGNTIAFNGGDGVLIGTDAALGFENDAGTGNAVNRNSIFNNAGQGIDLGPNDSVTPNDAQDPDPGANLLQNYPVLVSALLEPAGLRILGTINTNPNKQVRIEFFASPESAGEASGKKYLGFVLVTTDGNGDATFNVLFSSAGIAVDTVITTTATDLDGNTSEFSEHVFVA